MSARPLRAVLYARVSTDTGQQDTETQLRQLRELAAARGFVVVAEHKDHVTGDPRRRSGDPRGLAASLRLLQERGAEVLVIFAADRLVRSPSALLQLVERVQSFNARILSLQDGRDLDTTSESGELMTFLLGWFARMSINLTRERTKAGLERARAEGKRLGRPPVQLNYDEKHTIAVHLAKGYSQRATMQILGATRREVLHVVEWIKNGGLEAGPGPDEEGSA